MRRAGAVYEPFFKGEVRVEKGRVIWAFNDRVWPVLSNHKPRGRRRLTRGGAIYCTPSGAR